MINLLRLLTLAAAVAAGAVPALGQALPDSSRAYQVAEIWAAYQQLDFEQAEAKAYAALEAYDAFSTEQLAEIHTILALVKFSQDEQEAAREQFEAALSLKPELELDPVRVSPKILAFFREVKQAAPETQEEPPPPVRYIFVEDLRPAAALRSALIPGWGQLYKQEATKGWLLTGLWGATFSGAALSHVFRDIARREYLEETDPLRIEERYDSYNTWHKVRNSFLLGAAVVWTYSFADALLTGAPLPSPPPAQELVLLPAPASSYARLQLRLRF